jgi:hypothetical protein
MITDAELHEFEQYIFISITEKRSNSGSEHLLGILVG